MVPGVPSGDATILIPSFPGAQSHACFAKKAQERLNYELFRNGPVPEFYRLKALITLEQVNTSVVEKNKENLN